MIKSERGCLLKPGGSIVGLVLRTSEMRREDRLMWKKLIRWVIFSVLFSLVPLFANYSVYRITDRTINLELLLSHGELLLIAVGLTGAAIGEVLGSNMGARYGHWKLCSAGGNFLIVVLASMLFAFVCGANLTSTSGNMDMSFVRGASLAVYFFGFITSGCSIMLSEV
jgi:magnesium-transporting ATPase (P-type)